MGDEIFDEKLLTDKLSKLNSSQQCIESLSRWCVSQRKKAKQVVEIWEKLFKSAQREQQVSFLYLSNDILQNSRRKGSEFVNEFWKVLPAALKTVHDTGDENCKSVTSRLIGIWEERKVFGSRGQNLRNEIMGPNPSPPVNNGRSLNPIKVVKRDSASLRIKLAIGGLPERILTALQSVYDESVNEEATLQNFHDAVSCIHEVEKDVLDGSSQGTLNASDIVDNMQKQEDMIQQCIGKLENSEAIRNSLVSQLREALQEHESKLEQIRSEILVARGQIEQAANIRLQLTSTTSALLNANQFMVEPTFPPASITTNVTVPPPTHPLTSFVSSSKEDSKKATAADVVAKLSASSSSAQMLTSVFSSLAAEEASMISGLKRPKLEPPMSFSDTRIPDLANPVYFPNSQQAITNMPSVQSGTQSTPQLNPLQAPFLHPAPPPLARPPPPNSNQMGLAFGYGSSNLPPPMTSNAAMGYLRPCPPTQQAQTQQPQNQQPQSPQPLQQPPTSGGYHRLLGVGFYGQNHQPPTPPMQRQ